MAPALSGYSASPSLLWCNCRPGSPVQPSLYEFLLTDRQLDHIEIFEQLHDKLRFDSEALKHLCPPTENKYIIKVIRYKDLIHLTHCGCSSLTVIRRSHILKAEHDQVLAAESVPDLAESRINLSNQEWEPTML